MSKIFEIGEMDEFPEFEDYSSTRGKWKLVWSRLKWQYTLAGVGFLTMFVLFITFVALQDDDITPSNPDEPLPSSLEPNNTLLQLSNFKTSLIKAKDKNLKTVEIPKSVNNISAPSSTPNKNDIVYSSKNDTVEGRGYLMSFEGKEDNFVYLGLNQPWWDVSTVPVHLQVRNAILNTTEFIHSLKGTRKLVSIDLEVKGLLGNFTPVLLPDLLDYSYTYIGPYDGSAGAWYQNPDKLKTLLFFEKTNSTEQADPTIPLPSSWDIRDVANVGVNVSVMIRGTHLLNINRPLGFLVLNVDYAWEVLERTKGSFEKLVMVSCPFAIPPMMSPVMNLPKELKYLNLYNITNPGSDKPMIPVRFHQLLSSSPQLETLLTYHNSVGADVKIPLNLPDLPSTLKRMSLRGIQLDLDLGGGSTTTSFISSVEDLTLAEGRLSPEIIQNFESIFKNVKSLRLLLGNETVTNNQTDIIILVPKALRLPNVQRILVTGLNWTKAMDEEGLIQSLSSFGVPAGIENFVLTKVQSENQNQNIFISKIVSDIEVLREKYETFGFEDIESIEHYAANL